MSIRKVQFDKISLEDKNYYQENGCIVISGLYSPNEISETLDAVWNEVNKNLDSFRGEIFTIRSNFSQSEAEWNLYRSPWLMEVNNFLTDWDKVYWNDSTGTLLISWPQKNDWIGLHLDFGVKRHKISPDGGPRKEKSRNMKGVSKWS